MERAPASLILQDISWEEPWIDILQLKFQPANETGLGLLCSLLGPWSVCGDSPASCWHHSQFGCSLCQPTTSLCFLLLHRSEGGVEGRLGGGGGGRVWGGWRGRQGEIGRVEKRVERREVGEGEEESKKGRTVPICTYI